MCYNDYGDTMNLGKRIMLTLYAIIMISFCITVNAQNVSLNDMAEVVNNGVITKEFIEKKLSEVDDNNSRKWSKAEVTATVVNNQLQINYSYSGKSESATGTVIASILEDGLTLSSTIEYNDDDEYHYENEIEVHDLLVLWEIEASDGFKEIKTYVSEGYINKLNSIIDRCYRKEMHACRTSVNTYDNHVYTSDVELNEGAADYVIGVLKEEKKEADNKKLSGTLIVFAAVLGIIMLLLKACQPRAKKIKY